MEDNCIFCKIINKQASSSIVYEDEKTIAFMDIKPATKGHLLVIPKEHYENIFDIPEELNCYLHKITKRLALTVKKVTTADGISIIQQNGRAANQEVFHLHIHVIPRFVNQKIPHFAELSIANREQLDEIAKKIKEEVNKKIN